MPFLFTPLDIPDLILVVPRSFPDDRGSFYESYKKTEFEDHGIEGEFVQDNHSVSKGGVLRGLHYQLPPMAQGKLVRVIRGRAWDVAVDIRKDSPYFMQWVSVELNEKNRQMLYVPPGFAHGFVALSDNVHLLYKCTAEYSPKYERGIRWDEPRIGIQWPMNNPLVSERDEELPRLKDAKLFD
ncbi:MAG: dTDP-4-dehydrorhamnose 3,5-epimerase [bacterium]|nr:dTDP-4-dehydrorhamnose 3,5-epimerase [bacterium]